MACGATRLVGVVIAERNQAAPVLAQRSEELERLNRISAGREPGMIDPKRQVNELPLEPRMTVPFALDLTATPLAADPT